MKSKVFLLEVSWPDDTDWRPGAWEDFKDGLAPTVAKLAGIWALGEVSATAVELKRPDLARVSHAELE